MAKQQVALINGLGGGGTLRGSQQVALINGHSGPRGGATHNFGYDLGQTPDMKVPEGVPVFHAPAVLPEQGARKSVWPWLAMGLGAVGIGAAVWLASEE